jgi:hypothetical protein
MVLALVSMTHSITILPTEFLTQIEKVNEEITKAFESFLPTEKEKEVKRKERAEHPPKPRSS